MRKAILGAASALALASPAVAADLQVTPYAKIQAMSRKSPIRVRDCAAIRVRGCAAIRAIRVWGGAACHCSAAASGGL
jgi:hypothetical protein